MQTDDDTHDSAVVTAIVNKLKELVQELAITMPALDKFASAIDRGQTPAPAHIDFDAFFEWFDPSGIPHEEFFKPDPSSPCLKTLPYKIVWA